MPRTYRNVDHLQPVCVANQVVGEHDSPLQAGVGPFPGIARVGNVKTSNCDSLDLVALLGDEALDSLLVLVVEDRRHRGRSVGRRNNRGGKRWGIGCEQNRTRTGWNRPPPRRVVSPLSPVADFVA